jgi:hypothetical protein
VLAKAEGDEDRETEYDQDADMTFASDWARAYANAGVSELIAVGQKAAAAVSKKRFFNKLADRVGAHRRGRRRGFVAREIQGILSSVIHQAVCSTLLMSPHQKNTLERRARASLSACKNALR